MFGQLQTQQQSAALAPPTLPSPLIDAQPCGSWDPRAGLIVSSKEVKVYHITDFLHADVKKRRGTKKRAVTLSEDQLRADQQGGVPLVLNMDVDEFPYDGITFAEWSAANARLCAELLKVGKLRARTSSTISPTR